MAGAGDIEGRLTPIWRDRSIEVLLAQSVRGALEAAAATGAPLAAVPGRHETFDAVLRIAGDLILVELEPAPLEPRSAMMTLTELDMTGTQFERAADLPTLCRRAAEAFRRATGYDRVMVYRFLDDGAGKVLAEDRDPALPSFLNHHFPASDIPRQARGLYVRNRSRVIPDLSYEPAPIRPAEYAAVDLSDVGLRSVSPIHIQYMHNMGVAASASFSIVKDGLLWGLIACHHRTPRPLSFETRAVGQTMASELARAIRGKEEAEAFRERIRLRSAEDALVGGIDPDMPFDRLFEELGEPLHALLGADGFAVVHGQRVRASAGCPSNGQLRALAQWVAPQSLVGPFATHQLSSQYPPASAYREVASGVLAVTLPSDVPIVLLWLRAEEATVIEWAGNPHKDATGDPQAVLTPRSSFDAWVEEVRGCARRWSRPEIEAAGRLRRQLGEFRQNRRLRDLNRELGATIADKEALITQKDHLLREVNHRVQNSLQLVQSFLALQARSGGGNGGLVETLDEAQRRISAVALVHRRLYQADQLETVDLSRYLDELLAEMRMAMGDAWARGLVATLSPILISADRAIHVGLILTELVINANKYAYGGDSGAIEVTLEQYRSSFRLIVADSGVGARPEGRQGFGTRMIAAMVHRLDGTIERFDNEPGLRVIVTAPID